MAMYEKRLCYQSVSVDILGGENYKPCYLEINPRGEVPVLRDGVKVIPDSNRIVDYLEDNFSNGKLVVCYLLFIRNRFNSESEEEED